MDHDDSLLRSNAEEHDVVYNPIAHLPPVLSPSKPMQVEETEIVQTVGDQGEHGDAVVGEAGAHNVDGPVPLQVVYPEVCEQIGRAHV